MGASKRIRGRVRDAIKRLQLKPGLPMHMRRDLEAHVAQHIRKSSPNAAGKVKETTHMRQNALQS